MSEAEPVEVWRGGVNTWECDEMGHMNVRFYLARAQEGLAGLAARLGALRAFTPRASATLHVREHHIRYVREARAGAALVMTGGVVEMGETEAVLVLLMTHAASGEPCAAVTARVEHAAPAQGRPFPWPARVREAARGLTIQTPAWARPRSIPGHTARPTDCGLQQAQALGLECVVRTVVTAQDCDVFGRMGPERVLGRVSEGVGGLLSGLREAIAEASGVSRVGGAALEMRLDYREFPGAGDHIEVRSGLMALEDKVQRIGHWVLDPIEGRVWATVQVTAANFDLDARKVIPIPDDVRRRFAHRVTPGFAA